MHRNAGTKCLTMATVRRVSIVEGSIRLIGFGARVTLGPGRRVAWRRAAVPNKSWS